MIVTPTNSLTIMVDVQEKLFPHICEYETLSKNMEILIEGLKLFEIPFIINEQYPNGLGHTIPNLKEKIPDSVPNEKLTFSCCAEKQTKCSILKSKKSTAIVFGIETHICVLQTCLDLIANNISPVLVTNCCGSRKQNDHDVALMRMVQAGVIPVTYEALLFELCKRSDNPLFKKISALVK